MLFYFFYKEAKRLHQHKGSSVFKGLATGTNSFGEVRRQIHVVNDSHEQMSSVLSACKETFTSYGQFLSSLVFTGNPYRDKNFFNKMFHNLQIERNVDTNQSLAQH